MTSNKLPRTVVVNDLPGPDFTTYQVDEPLAYQPPEVDQEQQSAAATPDSDHKYSHDGSFLIQRSENLADASVARGLACSAYAGNYWSVTLRCDADNNRETSDAYSAGMEKALTEYAAAHPPCKKQDKETEKPVKPQNYLGYCPVGYSDYSKLFPQKPPATSRDKSKPDGEVFLNDIYQVCLALYKILKHNTASPSSGLITVTGATDASKSVITRGLIFLILEAAAAEALAKKLRRPHLVTFEDPIEQYYVKDPDTDSAPKKLSDLEDLLTAVHIDYTPRQRELDADTLVNVIKDAKRQTPAVFFVGETRDRNDWQEVLDFAGSGHLVITTSHAGSVVEAMTQLFRNTTTQNASQRSELARRIRGIVNIRSFNPSGNNITSKVRALLPAVWKSTSQSINNLVADGLSSILPALGREQEIGYYGRTYFAEELLKTSTDTFIGCTDKAAMEEEIKRQARQWDIEGV